MIGSVTGLKPLKAFPGYAPAHASIYIRKALTLRVNPERSNKIQTISQKSLSNFEFVRVSEISCEEGMGFYELIMSVNAYLSTNFY